MKYPLGETEDQFKQYLKIVADELNVHEVRYHGWLYTNPGWRLLKMSDPKATYAEEKLEKL